MKRNLHWLRSVVLVSAFFVFACSGADVDRGSFEGAPAWYDNPVKGCGVGSAKHRGMRDLTRKTAVASARKDLAGNLKTRVQGMLKSYQAAGEADGEDFTEELTTDVTRTIVDNTLVGTRTAATKLVAEELYAMVCLDPETFADAFDRMNNLSKKARQALKMRAKAEFQDLDTQLEKLRHE